MILSKSQLRFIDNYLQKSDVVFADIRMEMTDHIATAVENKMQAENLDFYDAFRNYMAVNKKEILKLNNTGPWRFPLSVFKRFFQFLLKPTMLLSGVIYFIILLIILQNTGTAFISKKHHMLFMWMLMIIPLVQCVYYYGILRKRFYYLEKNSIIFIFIYYCYLFFFQFDGQDPGIYAVAVFSYFYLAYVLYFISEVIVFRKFNMTLQANEA